ncbi:MAG: hypothetical protein FJ241_00975 [Nitrospira sp.]|nr:hypothetical protein [Nitrospira sp.]
MIQNENIKTFIKQTLGCTCPDEVFQYINCQSNIRLQDDIVLSRKINIGNRLLIYVIEANNPDSLKDIVPLLVSMGRNERDSLKLNRFRLVMVTDRLDEIKQAADTLFDTVDKDERIHLHVISQDDINNL